MLAALGVAALAGIVTVVLEDRWLAYRIMWTGFAAAGAAALLLPMSLLADRRSTHVAGLFGIGLVVVLFILVLGVTWLWTVTSVDEEIALTILATSLLGFPALGLVALSALKKARTAAFVGVAVVAIAYLSFLVDIWLPSGAGSFLAGAWEQTAWIFTGFAVPATLGLLGEAAGERRWWRWAASAATGAAAAIFLVNTWLTKPLLDEETLFVIASVPCVLAHANLLLFVPLKDWQVWVRAATIGSAAMTALFLDVMIVSEPAISQTIVGRLAAAFGILTSCGTLAVPILAIMNRRLDPRPLEGAPDAPTSLTIVCPVCRRKQEMRAGRSACTGCGLVVEVRLTMPLCRACGYPLFGVTSDRCPECGAVRGSVVTAAEEPPPVEGTA